MMKVLFVIPSKQGITGASIAALNIIIGLLRNNVQVFVVATKPPHEFDIFLEKIKSEGANLQIIKSEESGIKYWKTLAKIALETIKNNNIEYVHLHLPKLVYVLGKQTKKLNKKLILTVEGDPIFEVLESNYLTRIKTKFLWHNCKKYVDIFCPCSNWLAKKIQTRDNIRNSITIHNPIDTKKFQNEIKPLNIPIKSENEFIVMTAARLTKVKGIDILIKGYSDFVHRVKPKSKLIILGDGELKKELENLVKNENIEEYVKFIGFQNNPQDYIINSDVFVMTSNYEPFGMPAAESGCLGIPTIVSKIGGLQEIIIHGETGFQFLAGDYKELSKQIELLYSDIELRNKMSTLAKKHIVKNFSPEIIGKKFLDVYSSL